LKLKNNKTNNKTNMKKKLPIVIGLLVLLVVGYMMWKRKQETETEEKAGAWGRRTRSGGTTKGNFYNCTCDGKNYYRVAYPCNSSAWLNGCNAQLNKN
jgi:hypothetical protein